jgi:hypothetical protein
VSFYPGAVAFADDQPIFYFTDVAEWFGQTNPTREFSGFNVQSAARDSIQVKASEEPQEFHTCLSTSASSCVYCFALSGDVAMLHIPDGTFMAKRIPSSTG